LYLKNNQKKIFTAAAVTGTSVGGDTYSQFARMAATTGGGGGKVPSIRIQRMELSQLHTQARNF
jgi:hypothetical protein